MKRPKVNEKEAIIGPYFISTAALKFNEFLFFRPNQIPDHDRLAEGLDAGHLLQEREARTVPRHHSAQPLHQGLSERRHTIQYKVFLYSHIDPDTLQNQS